MKAKSCRSLSRTERRTFARFRWVATFGLGFLFACTSAHQAPPSHEVETPLVQKNSAYTIELSSHQIADGSLVVVRADFAKNWTGPITADFEGEKFALYPLTADSHGWSRFQGLFGIPHNHKPGPVELHLSAQGLPESVVHFEVVSANYPSEILKVEETKVHPPKKVMARIIREVAEIKKVTHSETPDRFWNGPFELPLSSRVTDVFGTKRIYNGELKSFHGGLDFHASPGTPIYSAGAGRVALAKDLYFSGNTVMIDHGHGLITMYFHMSKLEVHEGQMVSTHELLGLSGATGRVTGPHLHWQCDIHRTKVNPMGLVSGSAATELR